MFLMNWVTIGTLSKFKAISIKPKWLEEVALKVAHRTRRCKDGWNNCTRDDLCRRKKMSLDPDVASDFHKYVAQNLDSSVQLTPNRPTLHLERKSGRGHTRVLDRSRREALGGVRLINAMSDQIAKLTADLAESERKRVAEQESMSETIHQIKEQVMNLARRPTTAPMHHNESDEDDYVDLTP
ncbi:hypothetical protein H5410_003624 [Solanum commersonii]|uniref:Uncharacterized protein n=1 Tax=Solanum commersonii TaxID=4109 RepID=A0A9J6B5L9_SOLCO|nr:hypothetical protein H5410_003624 [Solanum commersonii]